MISKREHDQSGFQRGHHTFNVDIARGTVLIRSNYKNVTMSLCLKILRKLLRKTVFAVLLIGYRTTYEYAVLQSTAKRNGMVAVV